MTPFNTAESIEVYRAVVIHSALKLWKDHGIKANSAYTPKAMMAYVTKLTGTELKPRDYQGALDALTSWIDDQTKAPWEA